MTGHVARLRLLASEFELRSDHPGVIERMAYVHHRATHDLPLRDEGRFRVAFTADGCVLYEEEEAVAAPVPLDTVVDLFYRRAVARALAQFPRHVRLHAASCMTPWGLALLLGPKRVGKTTLALHLAAAGVEVLGDELVLLDAQEAITFPRRFYVREASLPLLPHVAALEGRAAFVRNPEEGRLIAVDPLDFGLSWHIRPAPLAGLIALEANHSGISSLQRCGKMAMVQTLVREATPPPGDAGWIAGLAQRVAGVPTLTLQIGTLESATAVLRDAAYRQLRVA